MAVCKNHHCNNKRGFIYAGNALFLIPGLCLFLMSAEYLLTNGERIRHHHGDLDDDAASYYRSQTLDQRHTSETTSVLSCPNCFYNKFDEGVKSQSDNIRLEAIKRQILTKLGLRHKPNITHSLPREFILETLSRTQDGKVLLNNIHSDDENFSTTSARTVNNEIVDVDDFYGKTSEIISFGEGSTVNGNRFLDFRITTETGQPMQELHIRTAMLWLKADFKKHPLTSCQQYLWAFRVKETPNYSNKLRIEEEDFGTRQEINPNNSGWQKLNLTDTVRNWLAEGNRNRLRILIDCSCSCPSVHLHMSDSRAEKRYHNRPFLVIYTEPNTAKRVRRRALDCTPDSGNQCCKQRFYVSFKELGWDDWVIAPQGYYANYCRGDCGHYRTPDTYVTYHTHVIEEMRKAHYISGMQPCCAPLKFSSMSLIYFGPESNIIKRDLPKMVVDECGCP